MGITTMNNNKKKRGRKPKGGKILNIASEPSSSLTELYKPNIILHLKCKSVVESTEPELYTNSGENVFSSNNNTGNNINYDVVENDPIMNNKNLSQKIKILNKDLHINNAKNCNTCFWDTCTFTSAPVFIPIDTKKVYGCFCSPECAAAYLFNEHCDTNTKWDRYSLLHKMYSSIYQYKNNIKLAPDPRYLLNKYYGNLSIDEYRQLHTLDKQLLIVNKPLTIVTPELYETSNIKTNNNLLISG